MKKNRNSIKFLYGESFNHIKNCKNFILTIVIIFFTSAMIGLIIPIPEELSLKIIEILKNLVEQIEGKNTIEIIGFIFINNLKASFIGLLTGIFLGIMPIILALTNGYLLGFVSMLSIRTNNIFSLWKLLPHGIFELPAIFISLGMGMKIGTFVLQKDIKKDLKENLIKSLITFILIIIPLLILAAIIEGILIGLKI